METLKQELQKDRGVLNAGLEAGFGSMRALYERAPSRLGMTPATYAKGGANTLIRFAVQKCALGFVLVARTLKGVCSISLRDTEDELESELQAEFYAAQIERDDSGLKEELKIILESLEGKTAFPDLPLDIRATAFQARVWKELQTHRARRNYFLFATGGAAGRTQSSAGRGLGVRAQSAGFGASLSPRGR